MTVECSVCGKETDQYADFGVIEIPKGDGEKKPTGYGVGVTDDGMEFDVPESRKDEYDNWMAVTRYTGSYEQIDYYECRECLPDSEMEKDE